jgi:hypothetical protein
MMRRSIKKSTAIAALAAAVLIVSCSRTGKHSGAANASFQVSILRSVPFSPSGQVSANNNPFLGAGAYTQFNTAIVLQVTNTTPDTLKLSDKDLKTELIDDAGARYPAVGYVPVDISRPSKEEKMQANVALDKKTNALTITRTFMLADSATVRAVEVFDSTGHGSWMLDIAPGKPVVLSCIFNVQSNRKAVRIALPRKKKPVAVPPPQQTAK